jgi:hypothetical protein
MIVPDTVRGLQFESGPEITNGPSSIRSLPDLEPAISPLPQNGARTKASGPGSGRSVVRDSAMDDASPPDPARRPGHDRADDSASEMSAMPPTVERPSPPVGDELDESLEEEADLEPKPPGTYIGILAWRGHALRSHVHWEDSSSVRLVVDLGIALRMWHHRCIFGKTAMILAGTWFVLRQSQWGLWD